MHYLQKHILDRLRTTDKARYSSLLPGELDSSHFNYHLRQLLKDKLVEQSERGAYRLTIKGKSFVDKLSGGATTQKPSPKVITYTLFEDKKNYYLHRKDKEPYRNLLNMVGGKVHEGESSLEAAQREVYEKTTQHIPQLQLRGSAEIQILHNDMLLSHAIALIFSGQSISSERLEVVAKDKLAAHSDLAPDLLALLAHMSHSSSPFIVSLRLQM